MYVYRRFTWEIFLHFTLHSRFIPSAIIKTLSYPVYLSMPFLFFPFLYYSEFTTINHYQRIQNKDLVSAQNANERI